MPNAVPYPTVNNPTLNNPAVTLANGVMPRGDGFGQATDAFLFDMGQVAFSDAEMTTVITGAPATCTIALQGTIDGNNWTTLATSTSTTGDTQRQSTQSNPVTFQFTALRVNVSNVTGGTSPKIQVALTAFAGSAGGQVVTGTVTSNQGTGNATQGNAWFVKVTDGADGTVVLLNPTGTGTNASLSVAAGSWATFVSNNASTGTGAGTAIDMGSAFNNVSCIITGTSTSYTVTLEASADGTTWVPAVATSSAQTTTPFMFASTGKPARFWRSNVTAIANGNVTTKLQGAA